MLRIDNKKITSLQFPRFLAMVRPPHFPPSIKMQRTFKITEKLKQNSSCSSSLGTSPQL
ncbi:hypothetical protein YC2023_017631 [Brassica napus]